MYGVNVVLKVVLWNLVKLMNLLVDLILIVKRLYLSDFNFFWILLRNVLFLFWVNLVGKYFIICLFVFIWLKGR